MPVQAVQDAFSAASCGAAPGCAVAGSDVLGEGRAAVLSNVLSCRGALPRGWHCWWAQGQRPSDSGCCNHSSPEATASAGTRSRPAVQSRWQTAGRDAATAAGALVTSFSLRYGVQGASALLDAFCPC